MDSIEKENVVRSGGIGRIRINVVGGNGVVCGWNTRLTLDVQSKSIFINDIVHEGVARCVLRPDSLASIMNGAAGNCPADAGPDESNSRLLDRKSVVQGKSV